MQHTPVSVDLGLDLSHTHDLGFALDPKVLACRRTGVWLELEGSKESVLNMVSNDFLGASASKSIEVMAPLVANPKP